LNPKRRTSSKHRSTETLGLKLSNDFAGKHPTQAEKLSKHQLIYSVLGLVSGLLCVIVGVILFVNGVTGSTSWTASFLGAQSEISDTAPGGILFIVGLFVIFLTRYRLQIK